MSASQMIALTVGMLVGMVMGMLAAFLLNTMAFSKKKKIEAATALLKVVSPLAIFSHLPVEDRENVRSALLLTSRQVDRMIEASHSYLTFLPRALRPDFIALTATLPRQLVDQWAQAGPQKAGTDDPGPYRAQLMQIGATLQEFLVEDMGYLRLLSRSRTNDRALRDCARRNAREQSLSV